MQTRIKVGDNAPNFRFDTPWQSSQDFHSSLGDRNVLMFLRYYGCPVCRMAMADLKSEIEPFHRKNAGVFVFLQSPAESLRSLLREGDWPFDIVCDPEGGIFALYGVAPGGLWKYMHPAGLFAAIRATGKGFFHKKFEGRETQLPAAFVVRSDRAVTYAYYGKHIADIPRPLTLAEHL